MRARVLRRNSLGWRMIFGLILGEVVLAVVLSVTAGTFSLLTLSQHREDSVRRVSSVIAASLMPITAEQGQARVQAQLDSILRTAGVDDLECIRIVDPAGKPLVSEGSDRCVSPTFRNSSNPLSYLTEPRVIEQPLTVDGMRVATMYVAFEPPGLAESLRVPGLAAALVLLAVALVSAPWSAWWFLRDVAEPLHDLTAYASRIAEGDLDAKPEVTAEGEVGELQRTLSDMADQLRDRSERLSQSYGELADAYRELDDAKREIEQLAALKEDFVAVAAHEIRSPLSTIALHAELLETGEVGTLDEEALDSVAAIGSASSRLRSIVLDLMDSALLERGLMPISFDDVWLDSLLEDAVRDANALGRRRGMTVRLEGEPTDVVIQGDALRLRQVLDNLLSNALKYSPDGTEVVVGTREDGDGIGIEVADRGRGIPEKDRGRLFTLFGRLDLGDSRDTAGLGLGLAISARVVEAHGGTLSFHGRDDGPGTVFTARFPRDHGPDEDSAFPVRARGDLL